MTADAGYHSEANRAALARRHRAAYLPDVGYHKRDLATPDPLYDKTPNPDKPQLCSAQAFRPAADLSHCLCPAGKRLYRNGRHHDLNGPAAIKVAGTKRDWGSGPLRRQCLHRPPSRAVRQVAICLGRTPGRREPQTARMKRQIDSERGRETMGRRCATGEPMFGNLRHNKGLNRFTLRGRGKVTGQGKL